MLNEKIVNKHIDVKIINTCLRNYVWDASTLQRYFLFVWLIYFLHYFEKYTKCSLVGKASWYMTQTLGAWHIYPTSLSFQFINVCWNDLDSLNWVHFHLNYSTNHVVLLSKSVCTFERVILFHDLTKCAPNSVWKRTHHAYVYEKTTNNVLRR